MERNTSKPVINLREADELTAKLTAAAFPGRTCAHLEAQAAALVLFEPQYKEEVPLALYRLRCAAQPLRLSHSAAR